MRKILVSIAILGAFMTGCKTSTKSNDTKKLTIALEPKSNSIVTGTAIFTEKDGKVTFEANISGLTPGVHAIHIHEKSDCSAADGSSAGGHWNPTFQNHGKWGSDSYHKGDIGNFTADANGNGKITLITDEWCIGCGDEKKDILGKGLIVHEEQDDFTSQPAGNAGARVACSAIIK
ncbi:superoxide dismutase family protein [Flavobacterium sp. TAB 87]|uniref:superoxide dismutase family protein n=1 Tax=Flavobacterium sp. TAB 87 TaxID=1729581 RepID=UPI00076D8AD7|nr:superoxide dismutase family protein [Flavobacterium sp. TAB 87]KVV14068.1 Superoxide dismutase-like protein YojM precursor [Flavobacterium sp. TAB 87]